MIITKICGKLSSPEFQGKKVDALYLDDTEAQKHILRKTTEGGRDIALRLDAAQQLRGLQDGDVLLAEGDTVVAVRLLPVPALVVKPKDAREIARFCYEVGNRHAPLYAPGGAFDCFAVRYDASMEALLEKLDISFEKEDIVLDRQFQLKLLTHHHHHHAHEEE